MKSTNILTKRKWWPIGISFIICHLSFCPAGAQSFTQRIQQDTKTGGRLNITHSKVIDDLVNGASGRSSESHQARFDGRVATDDPKPVITTPLKKDEPKTAVTPTPKKDEPKATVTAPLDTAIILPPAEPKKKVMLGSYKVTGYRVQAFAGGNQRKDRLKAEQTAANIKAHFPDEPVYTHFYSPRWICRVGNYRTYEEAHEMLLAIKKLGYTSAVIVKGKITVQRTE